jgi:hypothetical protein
MSFVSPQQESAFLGGLILMARQQPGGKLELRDQTGAVVATVQAHDQAKRPKDLPRALRPKAKLSKRQRGAARRSKATASA